MDVTHIDCGSDGWAHLAAVIDGHDREIVGYEFARRGRAKEAERALEAACIDRFGTLRPDGIARRSVATTVSSSRVGASAPPARTTGCARSSSRRTPRSRTA